MINIVVEGESDVGAARSVVGAAGREVARVIVKKGKTKLDPLIANFNRAAERENWVVFRDSDTNCPVELRRTLLTRVPELSARFALRIAHPMTEGWLLADPEAFAEYFAVKVTAIPTRPEDLQTAKQTLLSICATSRSRDIRGSVVLPDGRTGPLYVDYLNDFALTRWRPEIAASASDSLSRAIQRVRDLPD